MTAGRTRIPGLGPHGEGWVAAQVVLFVVIAGFGVRDLSARAGGGGPALPVVGGGAAVALAGLAIVLLAIRQLGRSLSPFPRPLANATLVDTGLYGVVRHPIYAGLLVAAAGWSVASASAWAAAASIVLLLVLDAKARREEAWLADSDPGYAAYRTRTRRLIPAIY